MIETEIALISRGTQPKTKAFTPNSLCGKDFRTYYRPTSYELNYVFLWSCGISTLALSSLLFFSFLSSKSLHLSSTLHTFSFGSGLYYPTTTHSLLFSLSRLSSFSLPSSCSPFNLPGLQWRRGRGNSMVTWHPAISLHCQLILAYRHAAVPCQPTSHHAPDIPRPLYRAGELQSTYNLQPLALVIMQSLVQNTQKQPGLQRENKEWQKRQIICVLKFVFRLCKTFIFILISLFQFQ